MSITVGTIYYNYVYYMSIIIVFEYYENKWI